MLQETNENVLSILRKQFSVKKLFTNIFKYFYSIHEKIEVLDGLDGFPVKRGDLSDME